MVTAMIWEVYACAHAHVCLKCVHACVYVCVMRFVCAFLQCNHGHRDDLGGVRLCACTCVHKVCARVCVCVCV